MSCCLARPLLRAPRIKPAFHSIGPCTTRKHSKQTWRPRASIARRPVIASIAALACTAAVVVQLQDEDEEDNAASASMNPLSLLSVDHLASTTRHLASVPLRELFRAWIVYRSSEIPLLVDWAPRIELGLSAFRDSVPLLGPAAYSVYRFVVRHTFFPIFVGGESPEQAREVMSTLLRRGCGSLMCYSVEAEAGSHSIKGHHLHADIIDRTADAIRIAGNFPTYTESSELKPTWCAIKLTGMLKDPEVLERATNALLSSSEYQRGSSLPPFPLFPPSPSLSDSDEEALQDLHHQLQRLGKQAKAAGVRIDIDAEQTYCQPAIDRYYFLLANEFNRNPSQPIIFNTIQCYLADSTSALAAALQHARSFGYGFGAKLVRGAYMDSERVRAKKLGRPSPIHASKEDTDASFDACAAFITQAIADDVKAGREATAVMFASHNVVSVRKTLEDMTEKGLIKVQEGKFVFGDDVRKRFAYGQLLGMADALTSTLLEIIAKDEEKAQLPIVVKYLPWGGIDQVLPYLIRRAQENKGLLQSKDSSEILPPGKKARATGVKAERLAIGKEIRKRLSFTKSAG